MRLRLENFKHNGAGDVKAIVSLLNDEGNILFQDKVNLCSAASRTRLQRVLSSKYPDMPDIEGTLLQFLNEAANDRRQPVSEEAEFSAEELEAGAKLLESPALLDILLEAVNAGGHVGETVNKKALILSVVSTRIKKQKSSISASTKGAPSSGKSVLVNEVISVCPQVWVYSLSRITTNALFYLKGKDLSRKVLFVDEMLGAADSDYGIRLAISEGQLKLLVTNKNAQGQLEAEEVNVPAENMCFISTTTKLSLHQEMETRVIDLYTDESERQTKEILKAEADEVDSEPAQTRRRLVQAALYQLQILDAGIPFASLLSECFPTGKVRARRDFPKLLSLIRASALLHQRQREVVGGKVLASIEDYRVAKEIADVIIAQTLKDLSPQEEQILDIIRAMQDEEVTVRKLYKNVTGITNQRLKNIVGQLREKGFISWNGEQGWKAAYTFVEDPRETLKLPTPEELLDMMHPGITNVTEMNFTHEPSVEVGNIGNRG